MIVGALSTYSIVNPREENRTVDRSGYLDQDTIDVSGCASIRTQSPIPIMLAPGLRCTRRSGCGLIGYGQVREMTCVVRPRSREVKLDGRQRRISSVRVKQAKRRGVSEGRGIPDYQRAAAAAPARGP